MPQTLLAPGPASAIPQVPGLQTQHHSVWATREDPSQWSPTAARPALLSPSPWVKPSAGITPPDAGG